MENSPGGCWLYSVNLSDSGKKLEGNKIAVRHGEKKQTTSNICKKIQERGLATDGHSQ